MRVYPDFIRRILLSENSRDRENKFPCKVAKNHLVNGGKIGYSAKITKIA